MFVFKSGLFSALADNHVIRAPIASGSISQDAPLAVELHIRSANLQVRDPDMAADKRADVQARMLGPEVLDSVRCPEVVFSSTAIEAAGVDLWTVTGRLTIHGTSRSMTFSVAKRDGRYRGAAVVKQRDFGIRPISIAGGTVKMKDELKIEFEIVDRER